VLAEYIYIYIHAAPGQMKDFSQTGVVLVWRLLYNNYYICSREYPTKINKEAEEHLRAFAEKVGQHVKNNNGFFDKIFG
jgi:hypothetical protein